MAALRRFDGILVGGQALDAALRDRAVEAGLRVVRTYGSSETSGGCVYDGAPIGTMRARAVDGQLELAGPALAEGYLGDPSRTERAFHEAEGLRWYRTGDLGTVAGDGTVSVLGRADNVIISGGEKVLLDAVERVVRRLPGLAEAVVVAGDDPEWGQVPVVVVPGRDSDTGHAPLATVREAAAAALGRAAAPARIRSVAALPRLASGKPDRVALTRLAADTADARASGRAE
jgi:O-succinylbenzoic acid--CoA ligase